MTTLIVVIFIAIIYYLWNSD
ncbi:hypothetical protein [Staphylococcus phage 812]|uniref:PufA n=8 Tax=Kayvirus G1 TaxID=292029 RepID=I6WAE8_9CAUD|nr:PufA cytochrome subunit [Staphylococcus phage 812]YP_009780149.1 hypothetical protein QLX23_gp088 [Staphylococcus phage ISP]YP_009780642.1 Puf [Staphylococcus phage Staph1N]YP_009780873.1 PufA [Staphylococcus phage A3R]YP_009781087.1 PufA [Staphylococcus phage 676Z]YP_009781320.1 PufA [Staphylococcus phage Fi200W]YP_009781553.1 PufA [Staphylococcus phage MSA6]YP_009781784.1 PufA [Staphylococcus phage P4W]YP_009782016.1 PufA [Staphylococcus phage A5W]AST15691.1 hypothetical protein RS_17